MIGTQQLAHLRVDARQTPADRFHLRTRAAHAIHIGRRSADVADDSLEGIVLPHALDLTDDRRVAARLDDAALMGGDGAVAALDGANQNVALGCFAGEVATTVTNAVII